MIKPNSTLDRPQNGKLSVPIKKHIFSSIQNVSDCVLKL